MAVDKSVSVAPTNVFGEKRSNKKAVKIIVKQ